MPDTDVPTPQPDGNPTAARPRDDAANDWQWLEWVTDLLDTRFRIPGTGVRFGGDFLLGLIPGLGDAMSMGVSGVLIATMARRGASPRLVLRMLVNVVVDSVFGTIPILGNLFDLFFKANQRNLRLMDEYYEEGMHRGPVWPILIAIALFMLLGLLLTLWLLFSVLRGLVGLFS